MSDMHEQPASSIKNKIIISFVLVIIIWGGAVNIAFQLIQESILQKNNIDPGVMREMMRNFIMTSSIITMSIIIVAISLALLISHRITLPIKKLIDGAKEVADGNLDVQIEVRSHDEIGQLSNAFNRMVAQRKHAEQTVSRSLAEKELLLREIHHRVKNNMAIVTSLLSMQARRIEGEKNRRAFEDSRNRIMVMALIHERLYQSEDLTDINVQAYLRSLIHKLMESYGTEEGNIRLGLDVQVDSITIDKLIPCGLIVNELVSNSLKYSFLETENGEINVSLLPDNNRYILKVSDNGDGIPEGLDINSTGTLGLQIVHSLAIQLKGKLQLSRGNGTTFTISFPRKESVSYMRGSR